MYISVVARINTIICEFLLLILKENDDTFCYMKISSTKKKNYMNVNKGIRISLGEESDCSNTLVLFIYTFGNSWGGGGGQP